MFRLIFCCAILSVAFGRLILPSPQQWDDRIIGGEETTIDQFPYQVSVLYIFRHICGGSIINERTVLTAAHCTNGHTPFTTQVKVGTTHKDNKIEPGVMYSVEKIIQHPDFTMETVDCDISILKLKDKIVYGPKVQPIALHEPSNGAEGPIGVKIVVTGWGSIEEGKPGVDVLRKVTLSTISSYECKLTYGSKITKNMFCVLSKGKDACQGDSGGPAVFNGILVGIVSWGYGCAREGFPGVFASIAALRPWIDANINA